ncbi:MAG: type II toxin-antitoxin system VapC family toxin [Bacteroidota bacterium]
MKLIDSNIIIYSAYDQYSYVKELVTNSNNYISAVSVVETLGYYKLSEKDKKYYESIFTVLQLLHITPEVINKSVEIRQAQNIKLGDAIIAATALLYDLELITRNIVDFEGIPGIQVTNPIYEL